MVLCLFGGTSSVSTVTGAAGIGLATLAADGSVLDTWFPAPELTESGTSATSRLAVSDVPVELAALIGRDDDRRTETIAVRTVIGSLDDVPLTHTMLTCGFTSCRTAWWRPMG
ncbi:transferase [Mycobacterium tuberculosis]|nr:transferase [Mycobacterium tuberculosis]